MKLKRRKGQIKPGSIGILSTACLLATVALTAAISPRGTLADRSGAPVRPFSSLAKVPVPEPSNLGMFVQDRHAAIVLGKALFWDEQLGSDGVQACASCHFHAGADNRSKNQIDPDFLHFSSPGNQSPDFGYTAGGPNHQITASDFPYHRLADATDRNSAVLFDSNDVTSSQGIHGVFLFNIVPGSSVENVGTGLDPFFIINGIGTRRVPPRHTPSVINSVFYDRNFWDGRAQSHFNGVDPFGDRNAGALVVEAPTPATTHTVHISIDNASLASQAVDPPLDVFEMSAFGRNWPTIGAKMLSLHAALAQQFVDPQDSVLGPVSSWPDRGINTDYATLIRKAFKKRWWGSDRVITLDSFGNPTVSAGPGTPSNPGEYTQMQYNFSLFFGLAVQLYESTLISDESPFDHYLEGDSGALTAAQKRGFALFQGKGRCIECHAGPELTNASVSYIKANGLLENITLADGSTALHDTGFENTGVRPTDNDPNLGRTDPFGNSFSLARMAQAGTFVDPSFPAGSITRVAADGAFKVPSLRNVALRAPYFHNGGELTLRQVVDFYNRGGDRQDLLGGGDTSGFGSDPTNVNALMQPLGLTDSEENDLVAFLESLTDERVYLERAPFDHPEILLPNGHPGNEFSTEGDSNSLAKDDFVDLPAVGKHGGSPVSLFLGIHQ